LSLDGPGSFPASSHAPEAGDWTYYSRAAAAAAAAADR